MILILLRHGETDANKKFHIQGITDNPLNEKGKNDAFNAGLQLKKEYPNITHIYSSTLKRAIKTAEIIADVIGYNKPILKDKNVCERNFGKYENMKADIKFDYSQALNMELPGGFENNKKLEKRANNAIRNIIKKHKKEDIILIASHSHFIKAFLIDKIEKLRYNTPVANGKYFVIKIEDDSFKIIKK